MTTLQTMKMISSTTDASAATNAAIVTSTTKTTRTRGVFVLLVLICLFTIIIIGMKNSSYSTLSIIATIPFTILSSKSSSASSSLFRSTTRQRRRLLQQQQQRHQLQEEENVKETIDEELKTQVELVEAKQMEYEEAQKEELKEEQAEETQKEENESEQHQKIDEGEVDVRADVDVNLDVKVDAVDIDVDVDGYDQNIKILGYDIPRQFSYDKHYSSLLPFPRWEFDFNSTNGKKSLQKSIMDSLLDFIEQQSEYLSKYDYSLKETDMGQYTNDLLEMENSKEMPHTSDHLDESTPEWSHPEALYVVDGEKRLVMTSQFTQDITDVNLGLPYMARLKYHPTERLMYEGLKVLFNEENKEEYKEMIPNRWPNLHQLIVIEKGSFPFLAHYSDFIGCNYHNWNNKTESIPLFTVAAAVHCNHTFPFPNFLIAWGAKYTTQRWQNVLRRNKGQYGEWKNRISKVVWRGTLTGLMPKNINERGPRWHLSYLINNNITTEQSNLFDIQLTTDKYNNRPPEWIDTDIIGGINGSYINMNDYQKYKAILDVDGHSWSSRFAKLLCFGSVILKTEPYWVDYFYSPANLNDNDNMNDNNQKIEQQQHELIPWKHYIPIKHDFSDLIEKTQYVFDPINEDHLLHIIDNANQWCTQRLTLQSLSFDVLDVFEKYITILDQSSQLKNLFHSLNNNKNDEEEEEGQQQHDGSNIEGDQRRRSLLYEDHIDWKSQWNSVKDRIYDSVLQMVPANSSW